MFGKKKEPKRRSRPPGGLEQYGIFEVPAKLEDLGRGSSMDDDNDEDLEAELARLTSGDDAPRQPRRKAPPIPTAKLDALISESMKDIDPDEELSGDDDDPDILNELREITGDDEIPPELMEEAESEEPSPQENDAGTSDQVIQLLEDRLKMYELAVEKAKSENESGRARRFGRGIKTLEGLLASAHSGRSVDESDIPPVLPQSATGEKTQAAPKEESDAVEVPSTPPEIPTAEPEIPPPESVTTEPQPVADPEPANSPTIDQESLELLTKRQREYKMAAVLWKKSGNTEEALKNVKIAKQFDIVLAAVSAGEKIDLSDMPGPPQLPDSGTENSISEAGKEESETQQSTGNEPTAQVEPAQAPITGDAIESALKERLEIYRRSKTAAEEEGKASKVRRYGRICKQFEDALKLYARGKPVPYDELPVPPGFPPIVANIAAPTPAAPAPASDETPPEPIPEPEPQEKAPAVPNRRAPVAPPRANQAMQKPSGSSTRAEKQALLLEKRQAELKQAALAAKKEGDIDLARDYLRQAKGITPLIEASRCGMPVDMSSIPLSPNAKMQLNDGGLVDAKSDDSFTLVSSDECLEEANGTDQQIYENMEKQIIKQKKWCLSTRDHSKALGDVAGYNRWERLALGYSHDLDMLRVRKRDGLPPPQHHYEVKTYAIVQSCTDLGDSDAEISIIRGVNYPKELDTYVMFEYPYPTDGPQTDRTSTIRDTSNPEYDAKFTLSNAVDRSARQCQRVFKRHALKCQVWSKGCSMNPILCCTHPRGFFRSDSLVGTVSVKLQPLETQCILHDSFPLMDGRKALGGKLEVKIRLRNPILTKQIEKITDKWLTIDY